MLNDNHPVSQAKVGTLAKGEPDQELILAQGCVAECGTCRLNKLCPGHAGWGSPSFPSAFGQPDPILVAVLGLQPAAPLLTGICNHGSSFYLSWPVAWFVR